MSALSVAEVLDRAADVIEPEGKWTQGNFAADALGRPTNLFGDQAACYCARGAIAAVQGQIGGRSEIVFAREALGFAYSDYAGRIVEWNDAPERTQGEVVAKLREAADLARVQS